MPRIQIVISSEVAGDLLADGIAIVRDRGSESANKTALRRLLREARAASRSQPDSKRTAVC